MSGVNPRPDIKDNFLWVRTWHEFRRVLFGIQGADERLVVAFGGDESLKVVHGREGLENRVFFNARVVVMHVTRDGQPPDR